MRKTIVVLFVLIATLFQYGNAFANSNPDEEIVIDILITEGGSTGDGRPHHAPALIPISASYYPTLSSILVDFLYDQGSVTVVIENQTTGTVTSSFVNAVQGSQLFPISGDVGLYEITFTLAGGRVYTGTFDIE